MNSQQSQSVLTCKSPRSPAVGSHAAVSASGCRATTQHPDRDGHRFGFRQSRRLCHRLAPARLGHGRERRSRQFGRPLLAQSPRNGRLPALHHDGRLHALQTGRGSARIGQGARQDRHHAGCRGRRRGDRSPETARNGRRREDHLLGRGRPAGFDEHARRDHPQGSAALARRRRQRPAQRTEQLQDIAQRAQFGNDEQQFQGCDPEHARLADQPHRGHHQPLDQVRSRRRGRHHQPHHPTQEAVPRIQRQRRRERHGVGEPGLQRQRQPLDPAGKFAASIMGYAGYYDGGRTPSESESWQENYDSENRYNRSYSETRAVRVTATSDWT